MWKSCLNKWKDGSFGGKNSVLQWWHMGLLEPIVMGLAQGLTEFIPVSSSGHLVIIQELFSGSSQHVFIQSLDIGTLLALGIFFRRKLWQLVIEVFVKRNYRLLRNIFLTALPVGAIGLAAGHLIEKASISPLAVALALAAVGVVMIVLEKLPKASGRKDGEALSGQRAFVIGLAQVLALLPGVSRSGSTIIAGRLAGLKAKPAAEYSFLVSIPIMFGLVVKLFVADYDFMAANWEAVLVGNIAAFIAGIIAIKFLIGYLGRHSLALFGWYRVGLAAIVIVLIMVGVLS